MNLQQRKVAEAMNTHFKRMRRLMPRDFPVDLYNADQKKFAKDVIQIFQESNPTIDITDFVRVVFELE